MAPALLLLLLAGAASPEISPRERATAEATAEAGPYSRWELGPPDDPGFFPVGVWLQSPRDAEAYRALGINTYVGLWKGPTEEQLAALARSGMRVICAQNAAGLRHRDEPTIVGWMQVDEPENRTPGAHRRARATPEALLRAYERMRANDPKRPVWLNLGQGVANDAWKGLGAAREDYPRYARACDILSFDLYPVANLAGEQGGERLDLLARGIRRLRRWSGDERIVWNLIETTAIHAPERAPTPEQVRSEVWMSIIHGSRGIVYFCHRLAPELDSAALLHDERMASAVAAINARLRALAPVLAAPEAPDALAVEAPPEGPVHVLAKRRGKSLYVFAVGMRAEPTRAAFTLAGEAPERVRVIDEGREIAIRGGVFRDRFAPFGVHLYEIGPLSAPSGGGAARSRRSEPAVKR